MSNLFLLIWLAGVLYIAWRYEYLILGLLAASLPLYLLRLQIIVPTTWLELTIYMAFAVWLWRTLRYTKLPWWRSLQDYWLPLTLIGIGLLVGTLVSSEPLISLGIIKGWFVDPLLLFILIINSADSDRPRRKFDYIAAGLSLAGVVLAIGAIYQVISGNFITVDHRASSWFSSANYLSLYLVPVMILVLGWWRNINKSCLNWIVGTGWFLMLAALYLTFSYAGWLALLLGIGVFWYLTVPSIKGWWWWAAGIILIVASQWRLPKFQQMLDLLGRSSSHVRLQVWQTALLMVKEHWLAGIGLGLFEKRYLEFANRLFHPPLETLVLHAHNILLQFWVNTGLPGIVGFIWLLIKWFRQVWPQATTKNLEYNWAAATVAAMLALLAHGMLDAAYWKNDLSALFWIILALGVLTTNLTHGRKNLSDRG